MRTWLLAFVVWSFCTSCGGGKESVLVEVKTLIDTRAKIVWDCLRIEEDEVCRQRILNQNECSFLQTAYQSVGGLAHGALRSAETLDGVGHWYGLDGINLTSCHASSPISGDSGKPPSDAHVWHVSRVTSENGRVDITTKFTNGGHFRSSLYSAARISDQVIALGVFAGMFCASSGIVSDDARAYLAFVGWLTLMPFSEDMDITARDTWLQYGQEGIWRDFWILNWWTPQSEMCGNHPINLQPGS